MEMKTATKYYTKLYWYIYMYMFNYFKFRGFDFFLIFFFKSWELFFAFQLIFKKNQQFIRYSFHVQSINIIHT